MSNNYQFLCGDAEALSARMKTACDKNEFRRLQSVWLRIANGLKVSEISSITCYSESWIRQLHSLYRHGGIDALLVGKKGGRNHANLTLQEENEFIQPFSC